MRKILETERLYLRELTPSDAKEAFLLNSDPDVIKYTGDLPFETESEAKQFLENYDAYTKTGVGRYAVIRKKDDAFLGWCGLKYHPSEKVVDVGYRLFKRYWNKGYATESTKAVIDYAFNTLKYASLVAHSHIKNAGSLKVLEKCNLTRQGHIEYDQQPAFLYHIDNPNYTLKVIDAKDTWPVRHPVLRAGRPLEDVYMEADEMKTTFHLGIFFRDSIVGVASFMENEHPNFRIPQTRLRGMAVLPEYRKRGLAGLMLLEGEALVKKKGHATLWFNARIVALNFYKEMGYTIHGKEFDIPQVGPHYVMYKKL